MTQRVQISCINKDDRYNPYERILWVGGRNSDGTRWRLQQPSAIEYIENETYSFFVSSAGKEANVIVAISPYGHKYLKTVADSLEPNNLLSLPECPK